MSNALEQNYHRRLDQAEIDADFAFLDELSQGTPTQSSEPTASEDTSILKDIGQGMIEMPLQAAGGVIDGLINDTSELTFDLATWLNKKVNLGQITNDEKGGFQWTSGTPNKNVLRVPSTPKAASTTGGVIREISNFVSLFLGAGKLKAFQKFQAQTKTGRVSKAALQGFIADYVNKPESNLSRLIQSHPTLENPVNEWLACDKDCGEMDKRLRTALEGIGVGLATEGVIGALRLLKQSQKLKDTVAKEEIIPEQLLDTTTVTQHIDTTPLGQTSKPLFEQVDEGLGDVYINWARIDSDESIKKLIQSMANRDKTAIDKARRGKRSWTQTKLSAGQSDAWAILKELNQRGKGATLNAEESVALRELWIRSGTKLKELAQTAAVDSNPNVQFQFQKMMGIHRAIQEKAIAVRTEAARALNSWKIPTGGNLEKIMEFDQVMGRIGGVDASQAVAKKITSLQNRPDALDAYVRGAVWTTTQEAAAQLWYFSLLSNPHTHMRNFISNSVTSLFDVAERKTASVLGTNVAPNEATAKLLGMVGGFKDALRITARGRQTLLTAAKETVKGKASQAGNQLAGAADEFGTVYRTAVTGESSLGQGGKVDIGQRGHISKLTHQLVGEKLAKAPLPEALHKAAGLLDTALQIPAKSLDAVTLVPSRALQTADELFKTINYQGELHAQAIQNAWKMAQTGDIAPDQIGAKVADTLADPDEFMRIRAQSQAEYLTFTNMPSHDSPLWQAIRGIGGIPLAGRIIMPFTRVVYNMGGYTFERTPLAPMVRRWRDDMAAGGRARDLALSKMALGTMVLTAAVDLSMKGHITGVGSPDLGERAADRRMKVQPNSVKIGDRYYAYRGLEPLASPLGIAANLTEILAYSQNDENTQTDEIVIAASLAIGNQLVSQQYMMGVANLFDAMSDPTRKGQAWFNALARAMIPAGVGQYTRSVVDTDLHQVENMIDAMKARIPGLSADVPYTIDLWGRKISLRSGLGEVYDMISPIYSKQYAPEPIDLELKRLGYYPQGMPRKLSFDGVNIDMENYPKAWERLKVLAGNEAKTDQYGIPIDPITRAGLKDTLNRVVQQNHAGHPLYNMLSDGPDGGKALEIRQIVRKFRESAKQRLLLEYPEIAAEVKLKKNEAALYNFEGS